MKIQQSSLIVLLTATALVPWITTSHSATLNGLTTDNTVIGTTAGSVGTGVNADPNLEVAWTGRASSTNLYEYVMVFQLPTLALGETIGIATLNFRLTGATVAVVPVDGLGFNIDLHGLAYRASSTVVVGDYFVGASDPSPSATLLQSDLFVQGSLPTAGAYTTSASGSTNLAAYLNNQYTNGATGGADHVFVRFTADAFDLNARILVGTANNIETANRPFIEYTVVPEPSSLALLMVTGACLIGRRRRPSRF